MAARPGHGEENAILQRHSCGHWVRYWHPDHDLLEAAAFLQRISRNPCIWCGGEGGRAPRPPAGITRLQQPTDGPAGSIPKGTIVELVGDEHP